MEGPLLDELPDPSPEASALAHAWTSLHQRLRGLESRMEAAGGGTEAVAERLETAGAAAKTTFHNGMAVFVRTKKGLMASADVSGTKYWKSGLNE